MSGYPNYEIDTPFGKARVTVTSGTHLLLDANSDGAFLTVNRVELGVSAHFELVDGKWRLLQDEHGRDYGAIYAHRGIRSLYAFQEASDSARKKLHAQLPVAVNEWAEQQGRAIFVSAERDHLSGQIESVESDIAKLEERLQAKRGEVAELLGRLNKLAAKAA